MLRVWAAVGVSMGPGGPHCSPPVGRQAAHRHCKRALNALLSLSGSLRPKSRHPQVYSFFLLTDDMAIANSSGGPKTLMYRVK